MGKRINWKIAENFFVTAPSKPTMMEMAEKYKVSKPSMFRHSADSDWMEKRERFQIETAERVQERLLDRRVEENISSLAIMESQVQKLNALQQEILDAIEDKGLDNMFAKELVDALTKVSGAIEKGVKTVSLLNGGPNNRTDMTFAELSTMKRRERADKKKKDEGN